jgi:outer membrane protein assembly factor BamB
VTRAALPLVVGCALVVAGCGSSRQAETATTAAAARHHRPGPDVARPRPHPHVVLVTVLDGDTGARLRGARVRIGRRVARADRRGVARLVLRRPAALVTVAWQRGYGERAVRLPFARRPAGTIRLYRPSLQWTIYGATPQRTQAPPAIRVRPPFRVSWSRGLGGLIEFPAVVADGVAYIANARGTVRALSMRDGAVLWRHDTPNGKTASSPAVWGDRLVVHGMDGHVWILRRGDGSVLWQFPAGSPIESSPIVVDDRLDVFGTWNGWIVALDLATRRVRWRRYDGCKMTSSAAVSGSTLYIGDYCGRLLALATASGRLRWTGTVNGRVYGTPAVAGGRVFVPSSDGGSMSAFSTGGRLLWRRTFGAYVYSSPAAWRGRVFFGSYNGVFYALAGADGRVLWSHGTGGPISGAAVVVDGVAYAGSFAHRIIGVDARSGRVLLDFPHGEYVPVSGSGRRLLLHGYSRVFAVLPR